MAKRKGLLVAVLFLILRVLIVLAVVLKLSTKSKYIEN